MQCFSITQLSWAAPDVCINLRQIRDVERTAADLSDRSPAGFLPDGGEVTIYITSQTSILGMGVRRDLPDAQQRDILQLERGGILAINRDNRFVIDWVDSQTGTIGIYPITHKGLRERDSVTGTITADSIPWGRNDLNEKTYTPPTFVELSDGSLVPETVLMETMEALNQIAAALQVSQNNTIASMALYYLPGSLVRYSNQLQRDPSATYLSSEDIRVRDLLRQYRPGRYGLLWQYDNGVCTMPPDVRAIVLLAVQIDENDPNKVVVKSIEEIKAPARTFTPAEPAPPETLTYTGKPPATPSDGGVDETSAEVPQTKAPIPNQMTAAEQGPTNLSSTVSGIDIHSPLVERLNGCIISLLALLNEYDYSDWRRSKQLGAARTAIANIRKNLYKEDGTPIPEWPVQVLQDLRKQLISIDNLIRQTIQRMQISLPSTHPVREKLSQVRNTVQQALEDVNRFLSLSKPPAAPQEEQPPVGILDGKQSHDSGEVAGPAEHEAGAAQPGAAVAHGVDLTILSDNTLEAIRTAIVSGGDESRKQNRDILDILDLIKKRRAEGKLGSVGSSDFDFERILNLVPLDNMELLAADISRYNSTLADLLAKYDFVQPTSSGGPPLSECVKSRIGDCAMWLIQIDARLADAPQAERTTETATQAPIGLADGQGFEPGTPLTEVPEYKAAPPADAIYEPFSNYTANYTAALLLTRSTQGTVEQLPYARRYAEGNLVVARENLARALLETRNNDAAQAKQQLAKLIKDSSIDIPLSEKNLLTDTIDRIAEEDAVKDLLARLAGPDEASRNRALIDASTALPVQLSSANFASQRAEGQRPATAMLNCATPEGETRYDASQLQWLIAYLPADALVGAVVNSKADAENLRNLRKLQGTAREIIGSVEEMQESESGLSWQEAFDKAVLQVRHRLMQLAGQGASVVFYSINSLPSSYPGMNVISPDITQGPEVIVNWLNGMLTQAGVIASEQPACDRALRILGGMV